MVTAHKIPNDSLFTESALSRLHAPHSLTEKTKLTLPKSFCLVLISAKGIRSFCISICSYSRARQDSET